MHIAWKYLYSAKDSWLGAEANLGAIGALYNLTMDPFEQHDMIFNGGAPTRVLSRSGAKSSTSRGPAAISEVVPRARAEVRVTISAGGPRSRHMVSRRQRREP